MKLERKNFNTLLRGFSSAVVLASFALLTSCGEGGAGTVARDSYRIEGKVEVPQDGGKAYLAKIENNAVKVADSVVINKDGSFVLTGKLPMAAPAMYGLTVNNAQSILVVLDSGVVLQAQLHGKDPQGKAMVTGSPSMDHLNAVNAIQERLDARKTELEQVYFKAGEARAQDPVLMDSLQQLDKVAQRQAVAEMKQLVRRIGPHIVSMQAVRFMDVKEDFDFLDSLARSYKVAGLGDMQGVADYVDMLARQAKVREGVTAPAIDLPTPEGPNKSLASLKGQVVLVDFWASWCGTCRRENPNVVKLYKQYKDQGFTVLGVSLDEDKGKWLEAIKKDGLAWHHVSDLNRWESAVAAEWQVASIPSTFLIDRTGKIAARDLHGVELEEKVKSLLKPL
jgi:peroxiredoxin